MNHLDLFSGIGGFSLAASWVWGEDHNIVAFVEQDKYCQKVLNKHWPNVPIVNDIRSFNGKEYTGTIDLLTGGFPCQPFSVAGKQRGKEDDRFLWHEMLRIIKESKPSWIIGENVAGIINMEFDNCITDLEGTGYEVQTFVIPACAVDARHRRNRVWIIANSNSSRLQRSFQKDAKVEGLHDTPSSLLTPFDAIAWNDSKRNCGELRNGDGIPHWVDRLKGLGNAIVPQVAYEIMKCMWHISVP